MKKFVIIIFALFCVCGAEAQDYRPLNQFGTDTIAYMRYNFVDRKAVYINQPLSKILEDYELELVFNATETNPYHTTETVRIFGVIMRYPTPPKYSRPYGMLIIKFKTPHLPWLEIYNNMEDIDDDWEWADKLKDCVVENIRLAIGPF